MSIEASLKSLQGSANEFVNNFKKLDVNEKVTGLVFIKIKLKQLEEKIFAAENIDLQESEKLDHLELKAEVFDEELFGLRHRKNRGEKISQEVIQYFEKRNKELDDEIVELQNNLDRQN